ncbi:OmpA family protein [Ruegeria pomeroyi]|jgi:outer membrane protein OmpA-like peptidoglycan-associated protein|uniref:OmpA domain protein n=2 Tax=Ruegeria pomeroyi TaxID=89184 RepID=Q5LMI7_RUEPO|nr:OmpA family protein [Ruegeria pomeroyi]HCE71551.1 OmpA family protein [Ruegeria sp.]AAV96801.1 OmpA domain protein [Ruegeria pomeroyi DSS-3]NVK96343.1 OmpA family protein [Ruegeria pomeroyi]NVK99692.1 OmpA family protein [Ruegeria pomeroyi]QWV10331.1 OmpA family protein [Ruegeria pomeroyi]
MTFTKLSAAAGLTAILALGACTDPASLSTNTDPNQKAKQGALIGGILGAGVGAIANDSNPGLGALAGAAIGAAGGGLIGNSLDKQAAELRQELANDGITITNTGDRLIVSVPNDITFDTDSSTVRPGLRSDLQKVAAHLVRYPQSSVQVIGHTDSDGEAAYNQGLSERRAGAVADILQAGGVTYDRISTLGMGENSPIASNLTPEGKARNRRVEIVVIPRN